MDQTIAPSTSANVTIKRMRLSLASQVAYDLQQVTEDGASRPRTLGAGRFAKVYAAQQVIAGQPSRQVAIRRTLSQGLVMKSKAPRLSACTASSMSA